MLHHVVVIYSSTVLLLVAFNSVSVSRSPPHKVMKSAPTAKLWNFHFHFEPTITTASPTHIQTMAASFVRSLRLAETNVCRQCASLQSRRTFASLSQNPKREIRSRTKTSSTPTAASSQTASPWAALSRRGYKTVQEAKSRARAGVRTPNPICAYHLSN